jgi:type VI secretion system protein ImpJ
MKRLQPVIWMKGTFLSPQYLQSQDRYLENSLQFHLDALNYCAWGFQSVQVDHEALADGGFSLTQASGILPDGLLFDIPGADPAPDPKPLADAFEQDQNSLTIYLSIPHHREPGLNIAFDRTDVDTRYRVEVAMARDENTGLSERPIQVGRKNFRFQLEGESQEGYSSLPVARVLKNDSGMLEIDTTFVAPLLNVLASDYLISMLRRLVEILTAKSAILAGTRRQKNLSLAEFGVADVASFWLLYTVNSHFPVLQHVLEVKRGHPEELYSVLLSLAGCLTTFSSTVHPRDLPKYDHSRLGACFTELDEKLRFLLETVIPSNFVSLPLKPAGNAIYATALADDKYLRNTRMFLAIQAELGEAELISRLPFLVKVCSATHIEHLVSHALPGVQLTHVIKPPSQIPVKLNYQYFSVNQSGGAWEAIQRARNLAAYVPAEIPSPKLELVILLPEAR